MANSKAEKAQKRNDTAFKNKIISTFKAAEFQYLSIGHTHFKVGDKTGDIDLAFLYKNILIICEYTTATSHIKEHLNKTCIFYREIKQDFQDKKYIVLSKLRDVCADKFEKFDEILNNRYEVRYLYLSQTDIDMDTSFMGDIKVVNMESLDYLHKTSKILKHSSRNELFKFLNVEFEQLVEQQYEHHHEPINTAIIAPEETSGLKEMQIVSFLMKAGDLMECGYVLRKDNWEESAGLYQRLLIPKKISDIRNYLIESKRGFVNNVIVSLPESIDFKDGEDRIIQDTSDLSKITNVSMQIPKKINSICIIDGQHRVYAHYKSDTKNEHAIAALRQKLHILVTGLIFKKGTSIGEKRRLESQLFLEINHNTRKVSADVLFLIESVQNPNSSISIARGVLMELNKTSIFKKKFEMTTLNKSQIKSTSIIKFALSKLVEIDEDKKTFFKYLDFKGKDLLYNKPNTSQEYEDARNNYIKKCAGLLGIYFGAVRNNFKIQWENPKEHKLFSVSSMNGFLIALGNTLEPHGVKDFEFYNSSLQRLKIDFSKENFPHVSSKGWNDFAKKIQSQCFEK